MLVIRGVRWPSAGPGSWICQGSDQIEDHSRLRVRALLGVFLLPEVVVLDSELVLLSRELSL